MAIIQTTNKLNPKQIKLNDLFSFTITSTTTTTSTISSNSSSLQASTSSSFSSSSSESMMDENIKIAESMAILHPHSYPSIFHENTYFINCVKGLHRAMHFLVTHDTKSDKLIVAQRLMQIAMKRLVRKFRLILLNRDYLEPESVSSLSSQSNINSEDGCYLKQPSMIVAIPNLRLIADTMISCGYGKECIVIYKNLRKLAINEALFHLGIQPYKSSRIKTTINAPHFDNHVKTWLNAVQVAVKTLFHNEKFLCNHIFASYKTISISCFEHSTKEAAMNLFTFPELIAIRCKKLKSKTVFIIMDLHNSISNLWPEIESIFSTESVTSVKIQALSSLHKLSDSIINSYEFMQDHCIRQWWNLSLK